MMKIKKIDLSGVKAFLFEKGERLGVAICGVIALLFVGIGLMKAGGSSQNYAEDIERARKQKETAIAAVIDPGGEVDPDKEKEKKKKEPVIPDEHKWLDVPQTFPQFPFWIQADPGDNKKRNPIILALSKDEGKMQWEVLRGGYFAYELDKQAVWGFADKAAGVQKLAKIMKPRRMVLVQAVFPMKEQYEIHRKMLRFASLGELLLFPDFQPKPTGLNVFRCEILDGGKATDWVPIYRYDAKTGLQVAERIDNFYREAHLDDEQNQMVSGHLSPGLAMPLPLLANLKYPKLELEGITVQDMPANPENQPPPGEKAGPKKFAIPVPMKKEAAPEQPGVEVVNVNWEKIAWKKLPKDLQDKFNGKIEFFNPFSVPLEAAGPEGAKGPNPAGGEKGPRPMGKEEGPGPGPKGPEANPVPGADIVDALVRFIDIDVEPGKTYRYSIQVRMANPNFKKKDVAFAALADVKELVSPFTYTDDIYVGKEFFIYAADQSPRNKIVGGADHGEARSDGSVYYGSWRTAFQIHRWVPRFTQGLDMAIADWAIAERLLVRRGDTVGRHDVMIEVPVWNKAREAFEIGFLPKVDKKSKDRNYSGLPIHYLLDGPPPLLVDFDGGWKNNVKIGNVTVNKDESAVDALILTPEGKLIVRNSRIDTDPATTRGEERKERYESWFGRLREIFGQGAGGGAVMPAPKKEG